MAISGRQIRAARGLLEWTAEDLARKAGLRRATISSIESEVVTPTETTMKAVMGVFDRNGVEFTDNEGVAIRKHEIRVFSGKAGYRNLLDHIYETMKDGGRICQFNLGDATYLTYADSYANTHVERMGKIKGLDAKVLSLANETNYDTKYCTYRVLDKSLKPMTPYYVYGDFVIISLHEAAFKKELLSIHSKFLVERYVEQFEYFWKQSSSPKKTKR